MNILSFSSNKINNMLLKQGAVLKKIGETGIIETIYYKEEVRKELDIECCITTLEDVSSSNDIVIFDFLTLLENHYIYLNKVYSEITINSLVSEEKAKRIKKKNVSDELVDIFKESFRVIINRLVKDYHPSNIVILEFKFNETNEEAKKKNKKLFEFYKEVHSIIPGKTTIDLAIDEIDDIQNINLLEEINKQLYNNKIFKKEKIHRSISNIRYIFDKAQLNNKNKLIVIFSAFSTNIPKYNYVYFFKTIDCNKLFILDDYGEKGSYYLGLNGNLEIESSVMSLITKIMSENDIKLKDVIAVGSSKGGSAALYFGFKYRFGNVIAGAPQYRIGSYLIDLSIKDYAKDIFGDLSTKSRIKYDNIIRLVLNNEKHTHASILTSDGDQQYEKFLKQLEIENRCLGYGIEFEKCDIGNHGEIAQEFPIYLEKKLNEILCGKGLYGSTPIFKIIKGIKRRGDFK